VQNTVSQEHPLRALKIQYRAEFFNVLNRPNLGNPNTTLSNVNVGKITSAGDPRVVQMAVKLVF
jgi:hypothetical protein